MSERRFKRKLTPFLCQEMLYDFVLGQLDPERRAAVDEFVQSDRDSQEIMESIRRGLDYTDRLKTTTLQTTVLQQLKESENAVSLGRRYSAWSAWPESLRWSITAIVISTMVALIVSSIPWEKIRIFQADKSDTVEIAKIPVTASEHQQLAQHEEQEAASGGVPTDTEADDEETPVDSDLPIRENEEFPVAAQESPAKNKNDLKSAPSVTATIPKSAQVAAATPPSAERDLESDSEALRAQDRKEARPGGFVYRAFMNLSNLDDLAPKITALVREMGGEKAGEVELGWKRGTGRYYHFSMPEENEKKLMDELRAYGPVRISKDPHPRVMPQGQVRFILWIETANP